ncbi:MAG: serine protease [Pseudomonadota bacterium]
MSFLLPYSAPRAATLLAALLLALQAGPAVAIVGGKPATAADAPWMVAILDNSIVPSPSCTGSGGSDAYCRQVCGGVLIAPQWVLTAAHCAIGRDPETDFRLAIGQPDLNAAGLVLVDPDLYLQHPLAPNAPANYDNDIALLHLPSPSGMTPASIAYDSVLDALEIGTGNPNDIAEALGWGRLSVTGAFPNVLQRVALDFDRPQCEAQYPADFNLDTMLCALEESPAVIEPDDTGDATPADADGEGVCVLDSGGPLVTRDGNDAWLAGLVSWGQEFQCGSSGFPGVYARVPGFIDWIESATADGGNALADLGVRVTGTTSSAAAGTPSLTFTLDNNSIANTVDGVGIEIVYSGGTLTLDTEAGVTCTAGAGNYNCTANSGAFAAGDSAFAAFTAGGSNDTELVINALTVRDAGQDDYRPANDAIRHVLAFTDQPDLRVSIDGAVAARDAGNDNLGHLDLTLTVRNASTHVTATGVAYTLTVPAAHALVSTGAACTGSGTLSCTVGALAAGAAVTHTFRFDSTPRTDGTATLAATATNGDFPTTIDGTPDAADSAAIVYLATGSTTPPPTPSGRKKDSGPLAPLALTLLGLLALRRRR